MSAFNPLTDPIHAKVMKAYNRLTTGSWKDVNGKTRLGIGYASMIAKLPFVEDNSKPTMSTNGKCIKFNRNFVDEISLKNVMAILVHEADHVAYAHNLRMGERRHDLANISMDYAINIHLKDIGFEFPKGVLIDEKFRGWTWEKIYSFLYKEWEDDLPPDDPEGNDPEGNDPDSDGDQEGDSDEDSGGSSSGSSGEGKDEVTWEDIDPKNLPNSVGDVEEAEDENGKPASSWSDQEIQDELNKVATNVNQARNVEKILGRSFGKGDDFQSSTGDIIETSQIDVAWLEQVASFCEITKTADYDFSSPNRRFIGNDEFFPSMDAQEGGHAVFMIDTSSSVSVSEMDRIADTINYLFERFSFDKVTIIYCNDRIVGVRIFERGDEVVLEQMLSGFTKFTPPFELIARGGNDKFGEIDPPTFAIYFTDGECNIYEPNSEVRKNSAIGYDEDNCLLAPDYPVLWASTNDDPVEKYGVSWGETVWIDLHG